MKESNPMNTDAKASSKTPKAGKPAHETGKPGSLFTEAFRDNLAIEMDAALDQMDEGGATVHTFKPAATPSIVIIAFGPWVSVLEGLLSGISGFELAAIGERISFLEKEAAGMPDRTAVDLAIQQLKSARGEASACLDGVYTSTEPKSK